jgi:predicted amidohydrolase YtcJ
VPTSTVVYTARLIRTVAPGTPEATAVAVRGERIVAVGSLEECLSWGPAEVDTAFANHVIVPGFVDAHSHTTEGMWSQIPYVGWFDRPMPDGSIAKGIQTYDDLVNRLLQLDQELDDPNTSLLVGGFDPIYFRGSPRLDRFVLDRVSLTRPILVMHASLHLATGNSALLRKYDITRQHPSKSLGRDEHGEPDGELREPPAMSLARDEFRHVVAMMSDPGVIRWFAQAARNAGVTTASDLAATYLGRPDIAASVAAVTADPSFCVRLAVAPQPRLYSGDDPVGALNELRNHVNEKLSFPVVKVVLDGSIQGWTAMISAPGYYTGEDHGEFLYPPEQLVDLLRPFHCAGVTIHCHCNGDMAAEVFLDSVEALLRESPWPDHRHTVQHAQLIKPAQLHRAKALGMSVNFFVNHLWFWGDQHHDLTVGPERARRMNPCGTAARLAIPFSIHSDAGVTPIGQLHTMWCAVNRITVSGRVLGADEQITPAEALHAVTLGAARQLRMDHAVGSIEIGKYADFAILENDPLTVDPMTIRDIGVWGTVLGGTPHRSTRRSGSSAATP